MTKPHIENLTPTMAYEFLLGDDNEAVWVPRIFVGIATHRQNGLVLVVDELDRDAQDLIEWDSVIDVRPMRVK